MAQDPKPECEYCGVTRGLRQYRERYGAFPPVFTCETCFTGTDTGPSFDDLPTVGETA